MIKASKKNSNSTDRQSPLLKNVDSLSNLMDDRASSASSRWNQNFQRKKSHSSMRLKSHQSMNFRQFQNQDTVSDRHGNTEKHSHVLKNSQSIVNQEESEKISDPVYKNFMGFNSESPLDQNFLMKSNDNSIPSNSPLRFEF